MHLLSVDQYLKRLEIFAEFQFSVCNRQSRAKTIIKDFCLKTQFNISGSNPHIHKPGGDP